MRIARTLSAALIFAAASAPSFAQAPAKPFVPTTWKSEALSQLATVEKKFTGLATTTPWEKYSYRPMAGVRSTCEVFLHIAGDNYMMTEPLGAMTPKNIDMKTIETCPASKDAVIATMKAGFKQVRDAVNAIPEGEADKPVSIFGTTFTKRGLVLAIIEHAGEHLGQSIAYARSNGIVPPWSK